MLEGEAGMRWRLVFLCCDEVVPCSPAGRRGALFSRWRLVFLRWDGALSHSSVGRRGGASSSSAGAMRCL
ncbi:hypothetical protein BHE74_00027840, partial [Ensete ventricosum]